MDLNPFPPAIWNSLDESIPHEIAEYVKQQDVPLLVILCAWMDSGVDHLQEWDPKTLEFWLARLRPLWQTSNDKPFRNETIVVLCNKCGSEGGMSFQVWVLLN